MKRTLIKFNDAIPGMIIFLRQKVDAENRLRKLIGTDTVKIFSRRDVYPYEDDKTVMSHTLFLVKSEKTKWLNALSYYPDETKTISVVLTKKIKNNEI